MGCPPHGRVVTRRKQETQGTHRLRAEQLGKLPVCKLPVRVAKDHGEAGGVAHREASCVRDGGWFGSDGNSAGLVDFVEDAERKGYDASRHGEIAVRGCYEDVAGGPADVEDFGVEPDFAAEIFDSGGEVVGELRVAAGNLPGAIAFGGVLRLLLDAE